MKKVKVRKPGSGDLRDPGLCRGAKGEDELECRKLGESVFREGRGPYKKAAEFQTETVVVSQYHGVLPK
jgi:hypothetical protein